MDKKAMARAYVAAVSSYDSNRIEAMITEEYIQHNPRVPTGRAPFLALIPRLAAAGSRITNIRMIEDGPFIVMQHRWDNAHPFGHVRAEAFHILRFNGEGLIAEHWNVMGALAGDEARLLAFVPVKDLHRTVANKARAANILRAEAGAAGRVHRVFGEGDTVIGISEQGPAGESYAKYDLFCFAGGEVRERFAVKERVMVGEAANRNTMFNFPSARASFSSKLG